MQEPNKTIQTTSKIQDQGAESNTRTEQKSNQDQHVNPTNHDHKTTENNENPPKDQQQIIKNPAKNTTTTKKKQIHQHHHPPTPPNHPRFVKDDDFDYRSAGSPGGPASPGGYDYGSTAGFPAPQGSHMGSHIQAPVGEMLRGRFL